MDQCEDGFGATVLLALLFKSSSRILHKIVNDDLLERFKSLIKKCGPHARLIRLFASTCWVENRPVGLCFNTLYFLLICNLKPTLVSLSLNFFVCLFILIHDPYNLVGETFSRSMCAQALDE